MNIPSWETQTEAGKPAIPIQQLMFKIPDNTTPEVSIVNKTEKTFNNINIFPTQPFPSDEVGNYSNPPFTKDEVTYNSDKFFPKSNIFNTSIVWMRNHKVLVVDIAPIRVNTAKKLLVVNPSLELKITLKENLDSNSSSDSKDELKSLEYDQSMSSMINGFNNFQDSIDTLQNNNNLSKYLILMDDQFAENNTLNQFITWKKETGNNVRVIKTSQVPAAITGAPTHEEVLSYLRGLSDQEYPEYLLLIGDEDEENGVAAKSFSTLNGGYTDLYLSCRTDTDYIPDLFIGRLPASTNEELTSMLSKVLEMEKNPPKSPMYDKILVAGQIQDRDHNNKADRLFCETADAIATYFENDLDGFDYTVSRAIVNPNNITSTGTFNNYSSWGILWKNSNDEDATLGSRIYNTFSSNSDARYKINQNINQGVAIVQHRDHGGRTLWGDPRYTSYDVKNLENGSNRPLLLSFNCLTGSYFYSNNFVDAWLNHNNGGAYAAIAATDVSFSGPNDWFTHGIYSAFLPSYRDFINTSTNPDWYNSLPEPNFAQEGNSKKLGQIINFGKNYVYQVYGGSNSAKYVYQLFHLFGDPEAYIQLHNPEKLTISHPTTTTDSTVTVTTGEDNLKVTLYSEKLGIHQSKLSSDGSATFNINPSTEGIINVTVTGYGKRPYKGTINFASNSSTKSNYDQVYFRGTPNSWDTTAMKLVDDYTWETTVTFTDNSRFKFDIYGDWSLNFGDNDNDGYGDENGSDIYVYDAGTYKVTFNDNTKQYTLSKNQIKSSATISYTINTGSLEEILYSKIKLKKDGVYYGEYIIGNNSNAIARTIINDLPVGNYEAILDLVKEGYKYTGNVAFNITAGGQILEENMAVTKEEYQNYQSNYDQVYFRGTPNSWDNQAMELVADHTWETTVTFAANSRFKFDIYGDWSLNFGDNNKDGYADQDGDDIYVYDAGTYKVTFYDDTKQYVLTKQ
ncbi:C25 family cysteine peptidase [Orenia marismortui]|uniref:C25 family cysteine peptidase n=1 Tax=Orenia marismortui TaxID=46469 RepID=UPI0023EA65C1|nr:C25 family cysteine peptidase [Orenia marismortui]